jgi:hypothetical protein
MRLAKDIRVRVSEEFGASAGKAIEILENVTSPLTERVRTLRCIVFLAEGDLRLLPLLIDQALADYRDVIFWAEYRGWENERPRRIRDFGRPFGKHALVSTGSAGDKARLPSDVRRFFERKIGR